MDRIDYFIKLPIYWAILNAPLVLLGVAADRFFPGPWFPDTPLGKLCGGAIGLPLALWFLVASPSVSRNAAQRNSVEYEPFFSALVSALSELRLFLSGFPIVGVFFRSRVPPTGEGPNEPE